MRHLRTCFTPALCLLAVSLTVAVVLLALFTTARAKDEVRLRIGHGQIPVALWTENLIQSATGQIVQRMGMHRWRARELEGELGKNTHWGLMSLREVIGTQDSQNRALHIAEVDQSLADIFGIDTCQSQVLYPLIGHTLTGTLQSLELGQLRIGRPLATSLSAMFADAANIAAVRCVPYLEYGNYMIAVLQDAQSLSALKLRVQGREQNPFGDGFREVTRAEFVALARGNLHMQRARLLSLASRSLLGMLFAISVIVTTIEVLTRRQALAIGFVLGGSIFQHARRDWLRLVPSAACGLAAGILTTSILFPNAETWVLGSAMLHASLAIVPPMLLVTLIGIAGIGRGVVRTNAMNITQSPLVNAGFQTFWCLMSATLVVIVGLQMTVAARVSALTKIDWGYATDDLVTMRIALPGNALERQEYHDRVMALIRAAGQLPDVTSASVLFPAPWRYLGLDDVQGKVVNGWRAGPAILRTLGVIQYQGQDISTDQVSRVVITQNVDESASRLLFRNETPLATMRGIRWNPFDATLPSLSILSIFDDPQPRFELVVRAQSGMLIANRLRALAATIFADAAIEPVEEVQDVIASRYAPLTSLMRIGNVVSIATLAISLLLCALVFAQIFAMQRREFAIQLCLGASHWRSLRTWRRRVIALALVGCCVGLILLGYVNHILTLSLGGFVATSPLQAGTAVISVLAVTIGAGIAFALRYLKRIDPAQALRY